MQSLGPYQFGERLFVRQQDGRTVIDTFPSGGRVLPLDSFDAWTIEAAWRVPHLGVFLALAVPLVLVVLGVGLAFDGSPGLFVGLAVLMVGLPVAYARSQKQCFVVRLEGAGLQSQRLVVREDQLRDLATRMMRSE